MRGEYDEASREHAPAAEEVGERAGGEQQRGEREGVGVDHPLQVGEGGVQSRWIDGSATFTTVMSRSSMKIASDTAISVHHLCSTAVLLSPAWGRGLTSL